MLPSTDIEIRSALHRKKLRQLHERADTLVVDELGLAHAKVRVDIAVINGCIHGYEIKSAQDTLDRLSGQLAHYEQCLEKLTLVCAVRHVQRVLTIAPTWCGVVEARKGPRGGIDFTTIRRSSINPAVMPDKLAHLLWRPEVVQILTRLNVPAADLRKPRKQLYLRLAELLSTTQITGYIREFMQARRHWRGLQAPA
jgi:hypothetical protein